MNIIPTENCRSDLELFSYTTCAHCNKIIMQEAAVVAVYYDNTEQQQTEHYCGEPCKQAWYIKRLQTAGM